MSPVVRPVKLKTGDLKMSEKPSSNIVVKMADVRLSFPAVFEPKKFDESSKPKYSATFRLDKTEHAAIIREIQKATAKLLADNKVKTLSAERIALKDGSDTGREEDEGTYLIKASSDKRPLVLDRDKTPLTDSDQKIYAGCRVNALISLWYQDHPKFGRRVNASLQGIMFNRDDEPFGSRGASADDFDTFGDDEDVTF